MKKIMILLGLLAVAVSSCKGANMSDDQKYSYYNGHKLSEQFADDGFKKNVKYVQEFVKGVRDAVNEKKVDPDSFGIKAIFEKIQSTKPSADTDMTGLLTDEENKKYSYYNGYYYGSSVFRDKRVKDKKSFVSGLQDGADGKKGIVTDEEYQKIGEKEVKEYKSKQLSFLEENKKQEGVKTTASGLQYKVIKEGTGRTPKETSTVEVNYEGSLVSGEVFDSSYERKQTAVFPLNGVIKGWTEGLQLMKEGSTYMFYIPSDLGYGSMGNPSIPGDSTLIFKVDLVSIKKL